MNDERKAALRDGWPVFVTAGVVGISFGVAARTAGLDVLQASGMSLLVFAGAAQFAIVELLARGAAPALVVATAFLINLRHLLMAASLRPILERRPPAQRLALAYFLTDESFALAAARARRGVPSVTYYAVFAMSLWAIWNIATIAGALLGSAIDVRRVGLDFAITACFAAIVTLGVRGRRDVAIALLSAAAAGTLRLVGASAVAVVVAGAITPLLFAGAEPPATPRNARKAP